jgi:hypothetical protein
MISTGQWAAQRPDRENQPRRSCRLDEKGYAAHGTLGPLYLAIDCTVGPNSVCPDVLVKDAYPSPPLRGARMRHG